MDEWMPGLNESSKRKERNAQNARTNRNAWNAKMTGYRSIVQRTSIARSVNEPKRQQTHE
eukprot:6556169-Lingulodinium_polyedra.AAC.1